jgi:hypothetical protein
MHFSNKKGDARYSNLDLTTRQNMAQQSPRIGNPIFLALLRGIFNFAQYLFCEICVEHIECL